MFENKIDDNLSRSLCHKWLTFKLLKYQIETLKGRIQVEIVE